MPKRRPNKLYTGEFKQMVVETMMREKISCKEAARRFEVRSDTQVVNVNEKVSHGDADIFLDPNAIVTIIHSLTYKDD